MHTDNGAKLSPMVAPRILSFAPIHVLHSLNQGLLEKLPYIVFFLQIPQAACNRFSFLGAHFRQFFENFCRAHCSDITARLGGIQGPGATIIRLFGHAFCLLLPCLIMASENLALLPSQITLTGPEARQ